MTCTELSGFLRALFCFAILIAALFLFVSDSIVRVTLFIYLIHNCFDQLCDIAVMITTLYFVETAGPRCHFPPTTV